MPGKPPIDISVLVTPSIPVWPGDTPFSCVWNWTMSGGDSVNVSTINTSPHAGTHADTPLHVTERGAASETLAIEPFNGLAIVIDVSSANEEIELAEVLRLAGGRPFTRLILKTGRSVVAGEFPTSWPRLSAACARSLMQRGLVLLGVDAPSIDDRDSKTLDVHHAILDNGGSVLENLDLRVAAHGEYTLEALPMRVAGLDAAPVRALLHRIHG